MRRLSPFLGRRQPTVSRADWAANAAKVLVEGGLGAILTYGYADSKPVAPDTTDAGRAKNRRVEVLVTI
jgi:flagellar motor protein MotB